MQRLTAWIAPVLLFVLLGSCAGSSVPAGHFGDGADELPELEWDLITDPWSTVQADEVDGEMLETDDALAAKAPSALPAGYHAIQGMYFTPVTPPGAGFSGQLSVRITMGNPIPNEYDGVRLFLFYIDQTTSETTIVDSERGRAGNWVTFDLDALGFFVIAENLAIPRPGTVFTVSAFADLAETTAGTLINFWAVPNNGTAPFTFDWDFGDGGTATGTQVTHIYTAPGTYNVSVIGTDALGNTAPAASTPIVITASPNPLTGLAVSVTQNPGNHLSFTYGATITGGTGPFTYSWDFDGDGTADSSSPPPVDHAFDVEGLYGGTLSVEDSLGDSLTADFVSDARLLVLATDDTLGYEPYDVTFSLVALGFAPGDPLEVVFGDGGSDTAPGATVQHTYLTAGTFNAFATGSSTLDGTAYPLQSDFVSIVVELNPRPVVQLTHPRTVSSSSQVDIYGYGFGSAQGTSTLTYGGFDLIVEKWNDNTIRAKMPPAFPAVGEVVITTEYGPSDPVNMVVDFYVPLWVQNVIPRRPAPGTLMLIVGNGFQPDSAVILGGVACTVLRTELEGIVAIAPADVPLGSSELVVGVGEEQASFDCEVVAEPQPVPVVESVTPQPYLMFTGGVTLTGSGFGDGDGGLVYDGNQVIRTGSWSDVEVQLLDSNGTNGWAVVIDRQAPSAPFDLQMLFPPRISGVDPEFAAIGETVTIHGRSFHARGPADRVTLGGNELQIVEWTALQIKVVITDGSDDGDIIVHKLVDSNPWPFTVVPRPPGPPGGGQT